MQEAGKEVGQNSNVIDIIARNDFCVGCGICAGISSLHCNSLGMKWNAYGEYVPYRASEECDNCGLCLRTCPFWTENDNETILAEALFGRHSDIRRNMAARNPGEEQYRGSRNMRKVIR